MPEIDDSEKRGPAPDVSLPARRGTWVLYPVVVLVAVVLFALAAPSIGMGTVHLLLFLYLGSAIALVAVGIAVFGSQPARAVAVIVFTLPGLCMLFTMETRVLQLYRMRFPPPRPMFHNRSTPDERTLLPFWQTPRHLVDNFGHWSWADWDDNLLVIVATGSLQGGRFGALRTGRHEAQVKVGDDRSDRYVTVKRGRDQLVVILPQGQMQTFALRAGAARTWEQDYERRPPNLLRGAADLLVPGQEQTWEQFVATYKEPAPTQAPAATLPAESSDVR